jgi:hypothetical protein
MSTETKNSENLKRKRDSFQEYHDENLNKRLKKQITVNSFFKLKKKHDNEEGHYLFTIGEVIKNRCLKKSIFKPQTKSQTSWVKELLQES